LRMIYIKIAVMVYISSVLRYNMINWRYTVSKNSLVPFLHNFIKIRSILIKNTLSHHRFNNNFTLSCDNFWTYCTFLSLQLKVSCLYWHYS
jgi:hypothetical protein